jgi:Peptidase propeptide and YPEB domain
MKKPLLFAVSVSFLMACSMVSGQQKFERARVYFEQNLLDKDVEVKFEATGGSAGLATMKVTAPDGRTVIDFKSTDSKFGIRHLVMESPEPKNDGQIQKDFPAGVYKFTGTLVGGVALQSEATLSHKLPTPSSFVRPRPDEKNVPVKGLKASWATVKDLAAVVLIIEQESSGQEIKVSLPGNASSFAVPDGFLQPGLDYKISVGTVSNEGNGSFVETSFSTAGKSAGADKVTTAAPAATAGGKAISEDDAKVIAIKAVPGKVINVAVEKLKGVNRYVVEVVPTAGGKEWDVIVDMTSGKVIGIEK